MSQTVSLPIIIIGGYPQIIHRLSIDYPYVSTQIIIIVIIIIIIIIITGYLLKHRRIIRAPGAGSPRDTSQLAQGHSDDLVPGHHPPGAKAAPKPVVVLRVSMATWGYLLALAG